MEYCIDIQAKDMKAYHILQVQGMDYSVMALSNHLTEMDMSTSYWGYNNACLYHLEKGKHNLVNYRPANHSLNQKVSDSYTQLVMHTMAKGNLA
jgi:hypothetical protein